MASAEEDLARGIAYQVILSLSCPLSILGSLSIIRLACRRLSDRNNSSSQNNSTPVYQKLMIMLSLSDVVVSLGTLFAQLTYPEGAFGGTALSMGNTASCTYQGYISSMGMVSGALSNAFLSVYFLRIVHQQRGANHEGAFQRYFQVCTAIFLILPHSQGLAGVATESINPVGYASTCWFTFYEYECGLGDSLTCSRGSNTGELLSYTVLLSLVAASAVAFVNTIRVWLAYRETILKVRRNFSMASVRLATEDETSRTTASRRNSFSMSASFRSLQHSSRHQRNQNDEYLRQVTIQAIWYAIVYFNQFAWVALAKILEVALPPDADMIPAVVLCYLLQPTNGLFNAIIYIRPRFTRIRKEHSKISRTKALWLVVADVADDERGDDNPSTMMDGGPEGADKIADDDQEVVEVFGSTEFGGGSKQFSCNGGSRQFAMPKIEESASSLEDPFGAQLLDSSSVVDEDHSGAKKARSDSPDEEADCEDFA